MPSGIYVRTEKARENMSKAQQGNKNALGKHFGILVDRKSYHKSYQKGYYIKNRVALLKKSKDYEKGRYIKKGWNPKGAWPKGKHPSEETKRKISEKLKGRHASEESKIKMSIVRKKYFNEHPIYVQNLIETLMRNRRPTFPEKIIINMNILPIWYCGNGQFWIPNNGKNLNPDFKIHGQKKVIEVFGDYWHKGENPQDRINLYKQIGFECLVIWEHELKEKPEYCRKAINNFIFEEIGEK